MLWTWWKNFSQRFREPIVGEIHIAYGSSKKSGRKQGCTRLGSSAIHAKNARSRRCSQKMERTRVKFTDVPSFQRITTESRLHSSERFSQEPQLRKISKKNQKRLWRTTHQTWKFQWSKNLHVHVQRHRFGQERERGLLQNQFEKNQNVCVKIHWHTLGKLGSSRKKQVISRICSKLWQLDTPCFTNCGGIREFWKLGIQRGKSAGSRNIENEKWSKQYPPQWRVLLHRFSFQNCPCGESALYLRSSHKAVWKAARGRFWKDK